MNSQQSSCGINSGPKKLDCRALPQAMNGVEVVALPEQYNLTQSEFAKKFGVPLSTMKNWEAVPV